MNCDISSSVAQELVTLNRDLRKTRRAAFADGTHKNHISQWRTYLAFCNYFSLECLPASLDTVCLFCQFLSRSHTPASVRNYLSGVKFLHVALGVEFPSLSSFPLRLTLRGIDRIALHCPVRAPPVTPQILRAVLHSSSTSASDISFSCAFLFAFFLIARISNIVPPSASLFDARKHLCRGDIVLAPHGLNVLFKWSKTNQAGSRRLWLPLVRVPNSPLCPVALFLRMCSLCPAPPLAPAFVYFSATGALRPIVKSEFIKVFRQRLLREGISDWELFRGHSFRRGGANWAFTSGAPGELIQVFGDWSSEAYKSYLESSLSAKLRVSHFMTHSLSIKSS